MDHLAAPRSTLTVRASRVCSFFMMPPFRTGLLLTTSALVTASAALASTPPVTHTAAPSTARTISAAHKKAVHVHTHSHAPEADNMEGMHHEHSATHTSHTAEQILVTHHHTPAVMQAERRLSRIPGGTSVIDASVMLRGRSATNADSFKYQAGVFAQAPCGSDDLRISIRGSGIQTGLNATRSGILFLFDGLPLTTPIGTVNELQEPLGIKYTEVLRGGNGFDYGSLMLGGAINYVTNTGYDAQTYQARVEAGSFGYVKEQLSSGKVIGKHDYYISVTNSYRSGYQESTKSTNFGVNFNYGYKFNDRVENRFFFRYRQTSEGNPYYLTRAQVAQNPKQAQEPYRYWGTKTIEPGTKYAADRVSIRIDDNSKLMLGFVYMNAPMDHELGNTASLYDIDYASGVLSYQRHDTLFGLKSDTDVGVYTTHDLHATIDNRVRRADAYPGVAIGTLVTRSHLGGSDNVFHVSNNTEVFHNFWLTVAGALDYSPRSGSQTYPEKSRFSQDALYFSPRAGFRYVINPHIQVYGNVSRSVQPAQDWQYLSGNLYTSGIATGLTKDWSMLKPQTATTFEVGTSGEYAGTQWSLSYYHSAVRNELLSVMTPTSQLYNNATYGNASPTTHQGVEFALHSTLYQWAGNVISLRQAYTYQDFRFNHDPVWGHNHIPGIPQHYYQGELHLDLKNGFYAAVDAEVASSVLASYDNRYRAAPYHIYNFNMGYQWPKKHRQVYLSFHNLANKHYATGVVPVYGSGTTQPSALLVGDGFGIFAGISVGFD